MIVDGEDDEALSPAALVRAGVVSEMPARRGQRLALARVARRSWWRRLLDALPRRRRALPPAVEICACGRLIGAIGVCWPCRWEDNALAGRPPPTAPPSHRTTQEQVEDLRRALDRVSQPPDTRRGDPPWARDVPDPRPPSARRG